MKVLLTGALGKCGTALKDLPFDMVRVDARSGPADGGSPLVCTALNDPAELLELCQGVDAVVHLAACSQVEGTWEEVRTHNISALALLFQAAAQASVGQVVFASSNHVVGLYERDHAPDLYEVGYPLVLDAATVPRPDSLYGVSKLFGEHLGRYHAERGDFRCSVLRLGAVLSEEEDHPLGYAEQAFREGRCQRGDETYLHLVRRLRAIWCSRRDFAQLVLCALQNQRSCFDIFYGVSANDGRWLDIGHAQKAIGYAPQDNGALWDQRAMEAFWEAGT